MVAFTRILITWQLLIVSLVGRHVEGNADMIRDLLEEGNKSILLLGEVRLLSLH